jgi:hypothetical protein
MQRLAEVTELLAAKLDLVSNELEGHAVRHNTTSQLVDNLGTKQDSHANILRYQASLFQVKYYH